MLGASLSRDPLFGTNGSGQFSASKLAGGKQSRRSAGHCYELLIIRLHLLAQIDWNGLLCN